MPSSRARYRSQRGQSTALVITMLMVFVIFTSMVVNVGQAVNRRIALQMVADAGAFTGGTRMAEGAELHQFRQRCHPGLVGGDDRRVAWAAASLIPPPGTCDAFDGHQFDLQGGVPGLQHPHPGHQLRLREHPVHRSQARLRIQHPRHVSRRATEQVRVQGSGLFDGDRRSSCRRATSSSGLVPFQDHA